MNVRWPDFVSHATSPVFIIPFTKWGGAVGILVPFALVCIKPCSSRSVWLGSLGAHYPFTNQ